MSPHQGLNWQQSLVFNIEHAKPVLEKVPIANSLLGDIPTACKQTAGWGGYMQASL